MARLTVYSPDPKLPPLLAAALITCFTRRDRKLSAGLSIGAVVAGFVLSILLVTANGWGPLPELRLTWLAVGDFGVDLVLRLDPLARIADIRTVERVLAGGAWVDVERYRREQ